MWVGGGGEAGVVRVGPLSLKVTDSSRWRDQVLPTALREYVHWYDTPTHREGKDKDRVHGLDVRSIIVVGLCLSLRHLSSPSPGPFVCVCASGGAESVIVALAILSAFYSGPHFTQGPQLPPPPPPSLAPPVLWWALPVLTKDCLRARLIHLQALLPPSPQPPPRRLMKQLHKLFEDHRLHPHNSRTTTGGAQGPAT